MTDISATTCRLGEGLYNAGLCLIDKLPIPIGIFILITLPITTWFFIAEWRLLGQPGNPAFQKQIDRLRAKAEGVSIKKRYRGLLRTLNAAADRLFGPIAEAIPGSLCDKYFGCQPWTAASYEILLGLAFLYPSVFLIWGTFFFIGVDAWSSRAIFTSLALLCGFLGIKVGLAVKRWWANVNHLWIRVWLNVVVIIILVVYFLANLFLIMIVGSTVDENPTNLIISISVLLFFLLTFAFSVADPFVIIVGVVGTGAIVVLGGYSTGEINLFAASGLIVIASTAGLLFYLYRQLIIRSFDYFWVMVTAIIGIAFSIFLIFMSNELVSSVLLFLIFLPLFNAPLDWLSLGVTRGLLRQIELGQHGSAMSLWWALIDIGIALVLLLIVSASSFFAYLLIKTTSPDSVYAIEQLQAAIKGGDMVSIGIWMMLASTLVPTFLHFLVALAAFVSIPLSRKRVKDTVDQLQLARDETRRRAEQDTNQAADAVSVDTYSRRWAMAYFFAYWPVVAALWLLVISFLSYVIYKSMQWLFITLLPVM